jgi:predicted TIM-barrel fold metal-dependent hydrolase
MPGRFARNNRAFVVALAVVTLIFLSLGFSSCGQETKRTGAARDCHIHLISPDACSRLQAFMEEANVTGLDIPPTDAEKVVQMLDEASVEKATVFSGAYFMGFDPIAAMGGDEYANTRAENDWSAQQVSEYPDRLDFFCSVNPLKDYAVAELARCVESLQARGLKLHFANSNVDLKNPEHLERLEALFAEAERQDVPVLMHFTPGDAEKLAYGTEEVQNFIDYVLVPHPGVRVCFPHLGGGGSVSEAQLAAMSTIIAAYDSNPSLVRENGFMDISAVVMPHAVTFGTVDIEPPTDEQLAEVVELMRQWGMERILYGCDFPLSPPQEALSLDARFPLTVEEYNQIMNNDNSAFLYGYTD